MNIDNIKKEPDDEYNFDFEIPIDIEEDDKFKIIAKIEWQVDDNINFDYINMDLKTEEIDYQRLDDNGITAPDKGFDQTCKSELNDIKDEGQCSSSYDNIARLNKPVNFNDLILQLPQAKVVLERYKPSDSNPRKTKLTDSQKQYKFWLAYCSSCKAPPRNCHIRICEKCGASMIYRCRSCDFSSNWHTTVYSHYFHKHLLGPYRIIHCLYCDIKIAKKANLHYHYKNKHAIDGLTRKYQEIQFYIVSTLANSEKYQCYKCNYSSSLRIAVKRHIQVKHNPRSKPTGNDFMSHETEKVKNLIELYCKGCNKLRSDVQRKCNDCNSSRLIYCCSRCQAKFSWEIKAIRHARQHLQGNHICSYCGKTFSTIQGLCGHKQYCLAYNKKR